MRNPLDKEKEWEMVMVHGNPEMPMTWIGGTHIRGGNIKEGYRSVIRQEGGSSYHIFMNEFYWIEIAHDYGDKYRAWDLIRDMKYSPETFIYLGHKLSDNTMALNQEVKRRWDLKKNGEKFGL